MQPVTVAKPRQGSCLSHFFVTGKMNEKLQNHRIPRDCCKSYVYGIVEGRFWGYLWGPKVHLKRSCPRDRSRRGDVAIHSAGPGFEAHQAGQGGLQGLPGISFFGPPKNARLLQNQKNRTVFTKPTHVPSKRLEFGRIGGAFKAFFQFLERCFLVCFLDVVFRFHLGAHGNVFVELFKKHLFTSTRVPF